jgi:hypothetical protein
VEICTVKSFGQEVPAERSKMTGAGGLCILAKLNLSACAVLSPVMENCQLSVEDVEVPSQCWSNLQIRLPSPCDLFPDGGKEGYQTSIVRIVKASVRKDFLCNITDSHQVIPEGAVPIAPRFGAESFIKSSSLCGLLH